MDKDFNSLMEKFKAIKGKGWIKTIRKGPTGIGKTFESLLGKQEDCFSIPDYFDIEIKTKRYSTNEPFCLFSAEPDGEELFESERIRTTYGYPSKKNPQFAVFNASIRATRYTQIANNIFTLKIDRQNNKLYLIVFNFQGDLIDDKTWWSFELLEQFLNRKLRYLAIIKAYNKYIQGEEYFKYEKLNTYKKVIFKRFIDLLEQGKIIVNFKIGVFLGTYRYGQPHNHGTGFNIYEKDIQYLYEESSSN